MQFLRHMENVLARHGHNKLCLTFGDSVVAYTIVCRKLWSREVPEEGANHSQAQAQVLQTSRKVTRMMIVAVVLFLLCWRLPYVFRLALHACLGLCQNEF